FVDRLCNILDKYGIRYWLDDHQMIPGNDIYDSIYEGINMRDKVILCCSENSMSSWWVDSEIDIALQKERDEMKRGNINTLSIIPIDIDGYIISGKWRGGKKGRLMSRYILDMKDWKDANFDFDDQVAKIVSALTVGGLDGG
ncbi:MAG: toll/interleukin-1 receptor domain-containing protein, partial [Pseudomonadota bacterium]